jgi:hypothetical protein
MMMPHVAIEVSMSDQQCPEQTIVADEHATKIVALRVYTAWLLLRSYWQ